MKQDRTIHELLQVMLDNQQYFRCGLCNWTSILYWKKIISEKQKNELHLYIYSNRPSKYSNLDAYKRRNNPFYWEVANIKPRLRWIKKHLKKTKP